MIKVIGLILFTCLLGCAGAQKRTQGTPVKWLNTTQITEQWPLEKRPVLADVYTDWCVYCKLMDNTIWRHDSVAAYLDRHFYATKINAEGRNPLSWIDGEYTYKEVYKVHMLAAKLLNGNMVYPSTVIIPPAGEPMVVPGIITLAAMERMLRYFGESFYLTHTWEEYSALFSPGWK